jgi:PfaD family protein
LNPKSRILNSRIYRFENGLSPTDQIIEVNEMIPEVTKIPAGNTPENLTHTHNNTKTRKTDLHLSAEQCENLLNPSSNPKWIGRRGEEIVVSDLPLELDQVLAFIPSVQAESLGDSSFQDIYRTRLNYYAGAMANGISSEKMVIALGQDGLLGSFGSGGLLPDRIEQAIQLIQTTLRDKPYAFNLLNSPNEPALEQKAVELYLRYQVPVIEASAYLALSPGLVWYRVSGMFRDGQGDVQTNHRVIAKVSRKEIAKRFLEPAPIDIVTRLLEEGKITRDQAEMSANFPMADDITVEADSGGHTDNRPLVGALPAIIHLRDQIQAAHPDRPTVRIGAAGGIATPSSALAAFMMGAAYVATGSVNQACVESGSSDHTRSLLAQAEMTDVTMAPASDMFEMGVKVQVLKRGTMFAMRAQKLYELYSRYESLENIPDAEREKLEKTVFKQSFDEIWQSCIQFFNQRDPRQIERANQNPKDKMALVFRWYLGLSSRWSNKGEPGREMDYQIWCGPAMGAFNDWVRGTRLEPISERKVVDVADEIMQGAAYLYRVRLLESAGFRIPANFSSYQPS